MTWSGPGNRAIKGLVDDGRPGWSAWPELVILDVTLRDTDGMEMVHRGSISKKVALDSDVTSGCIVVLAQPTGRATSAITSWPGAREK